MERHNKTLSVIKALTFTDEKTVKAFMKVASVPFINSISEICFNILHGNFGLSTMQVKNLRKHKTALYKLSSKKISKHIKRLHITMQLLRAIKAIWPSDTR